MWRHLYNVRTAHQYVFCVFFLALVETSLFPKLQSIFKTLITNNPLCHCYLSFLFFHLTVRPVGYKRTPTIKCGDSRKKQSFDSWQSSRIFDICRSDVKGWTCFSKVLFRGLTSDLPFSFFSISGITRWKGKKKKKYPRLKFRLIFFSFLFNH